MAGEHLTNEANDRLFRVAWLGCGSAPGNRCEIHHANHVPTIPDLSPLRLPPHSCPSNFAVALPTGYRAAFRRTFIAIFYMAVSVSLLDHGYVFLKRSPRDAPSKWFLPCRCRRYKRASRVYRGEIHSGYTTSLRRSSFASARGAGTFLCLLIPSRGG